MNIRLGNPVKKVESKPEEKVLLKEEPKKNQKKSKKEKTSFEYKPFKLEDELSLEEKSFVEDFGGEN